MDRLEEHIRKNRDDLDRYEPSPDIWKGIDNNLKIKKRKIYRRYSVAATLLILAGTAATLFFISNREITGDRQDKKNEMIMAAFPQLKETEIYYNNLITKLYNEATPMLTGHPEMVEEMNIDFSRLDSIYADLKNDLRDNISNEEVMEALIQNYRLKIRMLEEMLIILREGETDQDKKPGHEL